MRMLIAEQEEEDDGLKNWDLSVFRHPQSEKLRSTTTIKTVKTLELQFANEDGKHRASYTKIQAHLMTNLMRRKEGVCQRTDAVRESKDSPSKR